MEFYNQIAKENIIFTLFALASIGLIAGSFINVVISRLPIMMNRLYTELCESFLKEDKKNYKDYPKTFNLLWPRSKCHKCFNTISFLYNIPVLSWILIKGKCRYCKTKISAVYPIVESLGAMIVISAYFKFGISMQMMGMSILCLSLLALTFIDLKEMILPDEIVIPLIWLGLVFNINYTFTVLDQAVIGAIGGYLMLWSVYWVFKLVTKKEGLGFGDIKLMAALGAWLGIYRVIDIVFLSSMIAIIFEVTSSLTRKQKIKKMIPYGPYIALATWVVIFLRV